MLVVRLMFCAHCSASWLPVGSVVSTGSVFARRQALRRITSREGKASDRRPISRAYSLQAQGRQGELRRREGSGQCRTLAKGSDNLFLQYSVCNTQLGTQQATTARVPSCARAEAPWRTRVTGIRICSFLEAKITETPLYTLKPKVCNAV